MPKFTLNKLVRDNLLQFYLENNQKPTFKQLEGKVHIQALVNKLREETNELSKARFEDIASELADIQQVLDDLVTLHNFTPQQIEDVRLQKLSKKGGFTQGYYIETLELDETDEWTAYYRREPEVFPES